MRFQKHWLVKGLVSFVLIFPTLVFAQQPQADFTSRDTVGCSPVIAQFNDNSTGNIITWIWDFGDGGNPVTQNPPVGNIYTLPGCYDVTLVVIDINGNRDTTTKTCFVRVADRPAPDFISSSTRVCEGDTICFTDQTVANAAGISSWRWDFGGGLSDTVQNPCVAYPIPGTYTVRLRVTNSDGCDTTIVRNNLIQIDPFDTPDFTSPDTTICVGANGVAQVQYTNLTGGAGITFNWSFPGGNPAVFTGQNPPVINYAAAGAYDAKLVISNATGCVDSVEKIGFINVSELRVGFEAVPDTFCRNQQIQFNDTSILGINDRKVFQRWEFGDGTSTNSVTNPTHTYSNAGTYTVKYILGTSFGCLDSTTRTITVNPRPTADFSSNFLSSCDPARPFSFTGISATAVSWNWNLGGGQSSTIQNPTVVYNRNGSFDVTLRVVDANGCDTSVFKPNFIRVEPPIAGFSATPRVGCAPYTTTLQDRSPSRADPIISWNWTFDNGRGINVIPATSTQQNPQVTVLNTGQFSVQLIVVTQSGCRDTLLIPNFLSASSAANLDFSVSKDSVCVQENIVFTSIFQDTSWQYFWDINYPSGFVPGDSTFPTAYPDTGCYDVALIIDRGGCRDTLVKNNFVCVFPPNAEFTVNNTRICGLPATINITNTTVGPADRIEWFLNNNLMSTNPNFNSLTLTAANVPVS
ncbi:MAG: PKD domain-containing protein, partial [Bacteroidota bacterium]